MYCQIYKYTTIDTTRLCFVGKLDSQVREVAVMKSWLFERRLEVQNILRHLYTSAFIGGKRFLSLWVYSFCSLPLDTSRTRTRWSRRASVIGPHSVLANGQKQTTAPLRTMAEGKGEVLTNRNYYSSSIAGAWVLDLSRSDTMVEYLRILGTPEIAIQSQVATEQANEIRQAIVLNGTLLVIYKRTEMNSFTLTYIIGEELVTHSTLGSRRSTAELRESGQLDGFVIMSNFESPLGEAFVVETCKLAEEGHTHVQEITLHNLNTGRGNITRRVWTRVPLTDEDREHLRGE